MKKENTPIVVTSIIAGVILVIALAALLILGNQGPSNENTMNVQGTSTVRVLPDRVSVYFNVQTNGTTTAEANDANTVIYNRLYAALISDGFNESQIGTQSFNVYPNTIYDSSSGRSKTEGFTATHMVKVEFPANETNRLSSVVDNGINAGAGVSSVDFELSQGLQNQYKAQAIELASQDAETKAEALAKGFGKNVGDLVSVSVDSYNYMPWVAYSAGTVASSEVMSAVKSIQPTEQDVTASVTAIYKLN
jgi:uncharacterized protein YggE